MASKIIPVSQDTYLKLNISIFRLIKLVATTPEAQLSFIKLPSTTINIYIYIYVGTILV